MNNKFDELAKSMAQSVTRRGALKKFGLGLASIALISLGFPKRADAAQPLFRCQCKKPNYGCDRYPAYFDACLNYCASSCSRG